MVKRFVLKQWSDWLKPGSTSDSRLLHSDNSDRIMVCPSYLGQGYVQEIILREDLSLFIQNYRLERDLVIDVKNQSNLLEFEFQLAGVNEGYSLFVPYFGLKYLWVKRSHQKVFKVEIIFKRPTLMTYFHRFMTRLSPHTYRIAERVIRSIHQYKQGYSTLSTMEMLDQILHKMIVSDPDATLEQILSGAVYSEILALDYATQDLISPLMKQVIGQILSCPYQGATRRAYLERKALKLVNLRLETMLQTHLNKSDLSCIYQAEAILRERLTNPPTVEMLAHQVGTNRFKLNHGFHQVYGTTPYGYLRDYRLGQAKRLLMISELSIGEVAIAVGYTCRSKFARAFRQQFGINPKAYQIQAWQGYS